MFIWPHGLAVDRDGNIWVTDAVAENRTPKGDIFVADGHADNGDNRVAKFSKDGKFVKAWGKAGYGPGEFHTLHAIAMDSRATWTHPWGDPRKTPGDGAEFVTVDKDGNIYGGSRTRSACRSTLRVKP